MTTNNWGSKLTMMALPRFSIRAAIAGDLRVDAPSYVLGSGEECNIFRKKILKNL
jgi:hypothetical protein